MKNGELGERGAGIEEASGKREAGSSEQYAVSRLVPRGAGEQQDEGRLIEEQVSIEPRVGEIERNESNCDRCDGGERQAVSSEQARPYRGVERSREETATG